MLKCTETGGALAFAVRVVPRASKSEIIGEQDGALRVRLAALPVEGAANKELIRLIARALRVPSRAVQITSGHTSKTKFVRVAGVAKEQLLRLAGRS